MTTCKEQDITSKCIIKEKVKGEEKTDSCGGDNGCDDGVKGPKVSDKQMKEFKQIAVCMQQCLAKGDECDEGC